MSSNINILTLIILIFIRGKTLNVIEEYLHISSQEAAEFAEQP